MNVVAFKSREFAARIGAVVVAFVLAFSLVSLTAPARADGELDMKMWLEYSFSGDNVTFSYRYHSTMQGSDHKNHCATKYGKFPVLMMVLSSMELPSMRVLKFAKCRQL